MLVGNYLALNINKLRTRTKLDIFPPASQLQSSIATRIIILGLQNEETLITI